MRQEFLHGDFRLPQNSRQSSNCNFLMHGNDATLLALPKHDMTPTLSYLFKSHPLQRSNDDLGGGTRQLRHVPS